MAKDTTNIELASLAAIHRLSQMMVLLTAGLEWFLLGYLSELSKPTADLYLATACLAAIWLLAVFSMGSTVYLRDIQEIYLYGIFVQFMGLLCYSQAWSMAFYDTLCSALYLQKVVRTFWPRTGEWVNGWPCFGLLGWYYGRRPPMTDRFHVGKGAFVNIVLLCYLLLLAAAYLYPIGLMPFAAVGLMPLCLIVFRRRIMRWENVLFQFQALQTMVADVERTKNALQQSLTKKPGKP